MDCSLLGSSVHEILQARIPEWVAIPSSRSSSQMKDRITLSCGSFISGRFFTTEAPGKPLTITIHITRNWAKAIDVKLENQKYVYGNSK